MDEERIQQMEAFLELQGDRIEVLECLKDYAYFFPDWLQTISEGIQRIIDDKENKCCDSEKEILANAGYFFTKIAYFSSLISDWHKDMVGGKEETEKLLNRLSSGEEF
jgi:hypothetical protein